MTKIDGAPRFLTSQVKKLTGATRRQLENWENLGLLCPERTTSHVANEWRLYSEEDLERIQDILLLKEFGLELKEIRTILDAPEEERRQHMSACTERLEAQYDALRRRLLLSSIARTDAAPRLRDDAAGFGDLEALKRSYAQDENLQLMTRWLNSHTERDVEHFAQELASIASEFNALEDATWSEAEIVIARFCDIWSKRFGWPSIGQMLVLSETFSDPEVQTGRFGEAISADTLDLMSELFLLAWTSAGLESLDEILAHLYKAILDDASDAPGPSTLKAIRQSTDTLCALVSELGGDAHVHEWAAGPKRAQRLLELNDMVFDYLVNVALDDDLGSYLALDELDTIDADAIEMAQQMIRACAEDDLDRWLDREGIASLHQRADDWRNMLMLSWLHKGPAGADIERGASETELTAAFHAWFENWFSEAYPGPPEARWATQEESCARERTMRELIESFDDERTGT